MDVTKVDEQMADTAAEALRANREAADNRRQAIRDFVAGILEENPTLGFAICNHVELDDHTTLRGLIAELD